MSTSDDLAEVVFPQFSGIVIQGVEATEGWSGSTPAQVASLGPTAELPSTCYA